MSGGGGLAAGASALQPLSEIDPSLVELSLPQGATLPASGGIGGNPGIDIGQNWWDRNIGSIGNDDLKKALGGLGQGLKDAKATTGQGAGAARGAAGAGPSAGIGGGRGGGVSLDAIVQMLAKRQQALMASATGGVGAGQVPQARTSGLLGM